MNCDRVRLLLNGYIDGELDVVSSLDIEEHLQSCAECRGEGCQSADQQPTNRAQGGVDHRTHSNFMS